MGRFKRGPRMPPRAENLSKKFETGSPLPNSFFGNSSYTRRELIPGERKSRGRNFLNKTDALKSRLKIISTLNEHGIMVPKIISIDYENGIISFEKARRIFQEEIDRLRKPKPNVSSQWMLGTLMKVFRLIGEIHHIGIAHGHPHPANIMLKGNRVGLIDFKFSHTVLPEIWSSAEHIFL